MNSDIKGCRRAAVEGGKQYPWRTKLSSIPSTSNRSGTSCIIEKTQSRTSGSE